MLLNIIPSYCLINTVKLICRVVQVITGCWRVVNLCPDELRYSNYIKRHSTQNATDRVMVHVQIKLGKDDINFIKNIVCTEKKHLRRYIVNKN